MAAKNYPQDQWRVEDGCLVRQRNRLRQTLFTPTGTTDCPIAFDKVGTQRTTIVKYDDGTTETINDDWKKSSNRADYSDANGPAKPDFDRNHNAA